MCVRPPHTRNLLRATSPCISSLTRDSPTLASTFRRSCGQFLNSNFYSEVKRKPGNQRNVVNKFISFVAGDRWDCQAARIRARSSHPWELSWLRMIRQQVHLAMESESAPFFIFWATVWETRAIQWYVHVHHKSLVLNANASSLMNDAYSLGLRSIHNCFLLSRIAWSHSLHVRSCRRWYRAFNSYTGCSSVC